MTISISITKVSIPAWHLDWIDTAGYNNRTKYPASKYWAIAVDGRCVNTAPTKRRANRIAWRLKKEYDKKHNKAVLENAAPD